MHNIYKLHTIDSYIYNKDEIRPKDIIRESELFEDKILVLKNETVKTYNKKGLLIESEWPCDKSTNKRKYFYDEKNREYETQEFKNGILKRKKIITYFRDGGENHHYEDATGQIIDRKTTVSISHQNDSLVKTISRYSIEGKKLDETTHIFDKKGNKIKELFKVFPDHFSTTIYEYDQSNNLIKKIFKSRGIDITIEEFTYDLDNILVEKSKVNFQVKDKVNTKYFYNEYGDVIREMSFRRDKLAYVYEREYRYDSQKNCILKVQREIDHYSGETYSPTVQENIITYWEPSEEPTPITVTKEKPPVSDSIIKKVTKVVFSKGIKFYTQAEIDKFQEDYPDCTEIIGNVFIQSGDIQHLNGLSKIERINGCFIITVARNLESLEGLSNLKVLGGELMISYADKLKTLKGLENLEAIESNGLYYYSTEEMGIAINGNNELEDISALKNLKKIDYNLFIAYNPKLKSLKGLEGIEKVGRFLVLQDNAALEDIGALTNIEEVRGNTIIVRNKSLNNLKGLENLNKTAGINIENNGTIAAIKNLETLKAHFK